MFLVTTPTYCIASATSLVFAKKMYPRCGPGSWRYKVSLYSEGFLIPNHSLRTKLICDATGLLKIICKMGMTDPVWFEFMASEGLKSTLYSLGKGS